MTGDDEIHREGTTSGAEIAPVPNAPLQLGDPQIGRPCPFCRQPFAAGDVTRWADGGPADASELAKARRGLPYVSGPPFELHYDCGDPRGRALRWH